MGSVSTKIDATERLLNLVIALLGTRRGYSKSHLRKNVNGYASPAAEEDKADAAFERMFERDKKSLLELGIPITHNGLPGTDSGEQALYRIDPDDYRVPAIRLDESAMALVSIAANLWAGATLGGAAASALRKISTRAGTPWYEDETTSQSRIRTAEPAFEPLWSALRTHHRVSFDYRSAGSTDSTARTVEPWGLGSKYGQWYLAAFDVDKGAERSFRLSRITWDVLVHTRVAFARAAGFGMAPVLARLGTETPTTARIAVPEGTAHWLRNLDGTTTDPDSPWHKPGWEVLSVSYREAELMADDVAAMGTRALVVDPPELRDAVADRLHRAVAAAAEDVRGLDWNTPLQGNPGKKGDTRDRLVRLLSMVPYLVANPGVEEAEVLEEFGISGAQWEKDRDTLTVTGLPGYLHGDLMDVTTDSGQVFIRDAETLASPLRLTQEEACSVLVGLKALTALPGTRAAQSLRHAIDSVAAVAGEDSWLADVVGLELVSGAELDTIAALQLAIAGSRACAITYLVRNRDELSERIVEPRRLFSIDSAWYVRAWCRKAGGLRSFRLANIKELTDAGAQEQAQSSQAWSSQAQSNPAQSVQAPWRPNSGVYDPGTEDMHVRVRADAATARRLQPAYNAELFDVGDGATGLQFLVGDTAMLAPLMARLGGRAQVVAPTAVREAAAAWLAESAASYDAVGEIVGVVPRLGG